MLWSYEKPTEPGKYNANCGDVVTADSCEEINISEIRGILFTEGDFGVSGDI